MSVRVLNHSSLKLITVFLLQALSHKHYTEKGFSVWDAEDKYSELSKLVKDSVNDDYQITKRLSIWNCKSYAKRYPDQNISITEEARVIHELNDQWFYDFAKETPVQIHKTLSCYLYQIEQNNSEILKELERLCTEYGEWLLRQTDEWKMAKWE